MITEFVITPGEGRKRLDVFLCHREPAISRSRIQRLIELGRIRLNTAVVKPSHMIKPGDHITMDTPNPEPLCLEGTETSLDILHEDDVLLVINKPAGIVVHPTAGHWSGTLLNALLLQFQTNPAGQKEKQSLANPRFVHRLDKFTSGVMVMAKNAKAHRTLSSQFEKHTITRAYQALVWGTPGESEGVIELPIGRDVTNPKMISGRTDKPRHAVTRYRVVRCFGAKASLVELSPRTGRTHQLRVHMAAIGSPILGDTTYGGEEVHAMGAVRIPRIMLHAQTLGFYHPTDKTYQEYSVNYPSDMQQVEWTLDAHSSNVTDKPFGCE